MKITKRQLRKIIKEEKAKLVNEAQYGLRSDDRAGQQKAIQIALFNEILSFHTFRLYPRKMMNPTGPTFSQKRLNIGAPIISRKFGEAEEDTLCCMY